MGSINRYLSYSVWAFVLLCLVVIAAPAHSSGTAQATVEKATQAFYRRLQADKPMYDAHPERLDTLIEDMLLPYFDFEAMSRWVLGRYWRQATASQRQRFMREFRRLLIHTYAAAIVDASAEMISYLPERPGPTSGSRIVRTEVRRPGAQVVPIDYYMRQRDSDWKVYDVRVEGVSLITNYRSSFASEALSKGIDGLIDSLAAKNARPANAAGG